MLNAASPGDCLIVVRTSRLHIVVRVRSIRTIRVHPPDLDRDAPRKT
jgi:hypothetical protein